MAWAARHCWWRPPRAAHMHAPLICTRQAHRGLKVGWVLQLDVVWPWLARTTSEEVDLMLCH